MRKCRYCDTVSYDSCGVCSACGANDFAALCSGCGKEISFGQYCPDCEAKQIGVPKMCPSCGVTYVSEACPSCRYMYKRPVTPIQARESYTAVRHVPQEVSPKSRLLALLLCFFFGFFGIHCFYAGRVGRGILWLLTFGFFGFGWLIDCFVILFGGFSDKSGKKLRAW